MAKSGDLVRRLRVFLASPGDVNEERALVYDVVEKLRYERSIASVATVDVVAWDDPAGGVPLLANETPQQTIDNALVSPADCDIVVVVLWNRLGTPMPSDHPAAAMDRPPRSGTEYEFRLAADAANVNGRPKILVYRRTQGLYLPPQISRDERDALLRQVDLVVDFFESLGPEGGSHRGFNTYERPDDFQRIVEAHLRTLLHELVGELDPTTSSTSHIERGELWEGSPFPGLRSFTPADRPIFFGRGRETSQIVDRLRSSPFLAVVGASGSGKSSLVGAGLLPRLASGVLGDDRKWMVPDFDRSVHRWNGLRVTPAEIGPDPFAALAVQLAPLVGESPRAITEELRSGPARLTAMVERALVQSHHDVAVLFVDQFEELFTLVEPSAVTPYVDSIAHLVESGFGVVVLTMRSDFYQQCLELPTLAHLFERGQFPLPAATDALYEIVARPAERAGLVFDEGLIDRILADTGHDPNALPLLAFALDELYRRSTGGRLTFENYEWLGGVAGAIAMRADQVFQTMLSDLTDIDVAHIFKSLLEVDEGGRVVRRRAPRSSVAADERSDRFVKAFVDARLLVQSRSEIEAEPTVFVAHEALFSSWTRLSQWIATAADDLRLLGKLELAVSDWEEHHRADSYLWPHERLEPVYTMIARLEPDLSDAMRTFIRPEYERVIESFRSEDRETYGRLTDADRLLAIGPLAIPAVKDCLSSDDTAVRDAAANLIWRFGGPAVEPLVDGFDACGAEERLARLTALVRIGDRRALPMIVRAATDADRRVQSVAIGALETLGGDDGRRALESIATSGDTDARWRAAGALGAFGEAAVPSLVQALRDPDANVQHRAGEAILAVGAAAATALS
ncbi:MAG TPA: HEAT repeat domain-containing protein, partial [Ilumatobacteraceae bacterium]